MTGPDGRYRIITRGPKSFYTKVQGIKVWRRFDVGRAAAKNPFRRVRAPAGERVRMMTNGRLVGPGESETEAATGQESRLTFRWRI